MLDSGPYKPETLQVDVATAAIKGSRDYQEDSLISNFPLGQTSGFAVVADGLGGHAAGDVASALVTAEVFGHLKMKEGALELGALDIPQTLRDAAQAANDRVARQVESNDELYGMGSTLLVPVIAGDQLSWISIGDSPLFLFREGELRQINKDHSMAPQLDMMVKVGAMDAEVAKNHPERNALTSVVNGGEIALIDCPTTPTTVFPGDIVIASSDGLQFLENDQIEQIIRDTHKSSSDGIAKALLAAIKELDDPHQDNTAIVAIKIAGEVADTTASDDAGDVASNNSVLGTPDMDRASAPLVLADANTQISGESAPTVAADVIVLPQANLASATQAFAAREPDVEVTGETKPKLVFKDVKIERISHDLDTPSEVVIEEEAPFEPAHSVRVITADVSEADTTPPEQDKPAPRILHCSAIARASAAAAAADRILTGEQEPNHDVREVMPTPDQEVAAELRGTMDAPKGGSKTYWYRGQKYTK